MFYLRARLYIYTGCRVPLIMYSIICVSCSVPTSNLLKPGFLHHLSMLFFFLDKDFFFWFSLNCKAASAVWSVFVFVVLRSGHLVAKGPSPRRVQLNPNNQQLGHEAVRVFSHRRGSLPDRSCFTNRQWAISNSLYHSYLFFFCGIKNGRDPELCVFLALCLGFRVFGK